MVKLWTCSESGPVDGRALVTPITSPSASSTIVNYGNTPAFSSAETSHVDEDILSRIRGRLSTKGKAKELFQPTAGCFSLPFAMPLPSGSTNLPPSFEAGTLQGKPVGQEMGFTRWAVRVVGRRKGLLRSDRKYVIGSFFELVFSPNSSSDLSILLPKSASRLCLFTELRDSSERRSTSAPTSRGREPRSASGPKRRLANDRRHAYPEGGRL